MPVLSKEHDRQRIIFSMQTDWPALFLLAAMVLGGGTRTRLTSDFLLQLLALPLIWRMINEFPGKMDWPTRLLFLAIPALFLFQLLPLPSSEGWRFPFTLDAGRTIQAFVFMLVPMAVFHASHGLPQHQQYRLVLVALAGVGMNFLLALMQFAAPAFQQWLQPFSWPIKAGFFANENHLASLLFTSVPLVVAIFQRSSWPWLSVVVILLLLLFELVVGSQAGIGIIVAIALFSWLLVHRGSWRTFLAAVLILALTAGWWLTFSPPEEFVRQFTLNANSFSRGGFFINTWRAIQDFLPLGSGFGSFPLVYPQYEPLQAIQEHYANHVHNDWLELLLEGGIPAMLLLLWGMGLMVRVLWRRELSPLQRAAFLGLLALMLHSTVDYPLRTLALASLFALLLGILLSPPERKKKMAFHAKTFTTLGSFAGR